MRKIASSLMVALVVAALFWGNCFSCPEVLLSLMAHHSDHSCCHRNKPATQTCWTQELRHFMKADAGAQAVPAPAVGAVVVIARPAAIPQALEAVPASPEHAPPDLLSLHASFRI